MFKSFSTVHAWFMRLGVALAIVAWCGILVSVPSQALAKSASVTAIEITGPFPDATVTIDGQARGVIGTGLTVEVPAGTHQVEVQKKGYKKFEVTANVNEGSVQKVNVAALQKSSKTWIWVLVGVGGAILIGGAIAIAASSGGGGYYY